MKQINQGDIYLANLNPAKGHEQSGTRPVLILQNNILNKNLNTIVIAPITSNIKAKNLITTYFFKAKTSKLKQDSIALLFQIRTIDKNRLIKEVGHISKIEFNEVKKQLEQVF